MKKRFIATLNNMSHVPPGSIYRGQGKVDFELDDDHKPEKLQIIKEKLVELDDEGKEKFRKAGFRDKVKTRPTKPTRRAIGRP